MEAWFPTFDVVVNAYWWLINLDKFFDGFRSMSWKIYLWFGWHWQEAISIGGFLERKATKMPHFFFSFEKVSSSSYNQRLGVSSRLNTVEQDCKMYFQYIDLGQSQCNVLYNQYIICSFDVLMTHKDSFVWISILYFYKVVTTEVWGVSSRLKT